MAKTVRIKGTFEILNSGGTVEAKKVMNTDISVEEATQFFPQKLAPNLIDQQINFGGVAQAKAVFIRSSHTMTVKLNQNTDIGFSIGPGDTILQSDTGITALFITTGVNETELEIIIAGA